MELKMKRNTSYDLSMPTDSYQQLKQIAEQESTSLAELLRRATKWFLFMRSIKQYPKARLLVERRGQIQEVILDLAWTHVRPNEQRLMSWIMG